MSKNFELLTRLGEKYAGLHPAIETQTAIVQPVQTDSIVAPVLPVVKQENPSPEELKLAQRLFLFPSHDAPKSVVFCGIDEESGSTLMCARIAELLAANSGGQVCLVDAGPHSQLLRDRYGLETVLGFADLSKPSGTSETSARQISGRNLWLLGPGLENETNQGRTSIDYFRTAIPGLVQQFRTVLIAAGPVNLCPDTIALGRLVDGVVLVLKANSTRRVTAKKVKEALENAQVRVIGAVLTERTYPIPESLYRRL